MDERERKTHADIKEFGWHVLLIPEDEQGPAFAYSVGLQKTFNHPEILVLGLDINLMHRMVNGIGDRVTIDDNCTTQVAKNCPKKIDSGRLYHDVLRHGRNPDEHDAVWIHRRGKAVRECAGILLPPEITHLLRHGELEVRPFHGHVF